MSQAREAVEGLINDVTGLNPERPSMICRPRSEAELIHALKNSKGPVTIAGGRFSMGGHVAQDGALMLDMSGMDQVISVSAAEKRVRVQAGATWRSIQEKIDPMGLSVSVMQTYSNFTVGGSLSVNCHGRYMGKGPISLTVKSIRAATAQGEVFECSPNQREQDFWAIMRRHGRLRDHSGSRARAGGERESQAREQKDEPERVSGSFLDASAQRSGRGVS